MARRILIAGNWKMNGLRADGLALAADLAVRMRGAGATRFDMLVCTPFTLIGDVSKAVANELSVPSAAPMGHGEKARLSTSAARLISARLPEQRQMTSGLRPIKE